MLLVLTEKGSWKNLQNYENIVFQNTHNRLGTQNTQKADNTDNCAYTEAQEFYLSSIHYHSRQEVKEYVVTVSTLCLRMWESHFQFIHGFQKHPLSLILQVFKWSFLSDQIWMTDNGPRKKAIVRNLLPLCHLEIIFFLIKPSINKAYCNLLGSSEATFILFKLLNLEKTGKFGIKACNWIQDSVFIIEYQTSINFTNFFEIMINLLTYIIQLQTQQVFMTNSVTLIY